MQIEKTYPVANDMRIDVEALTRRVVYQYEISPDLSFEFDLLSEVGAKWQPIYKKFIADNNLQIELYDNPNDKHCHGFYERLKDGEK